MHSKGRGSELHYTYRLGTDKRSPLALFVHGRAGSAEVMWTFRRAVPDSWHILAPQAHMPDPIGGWSWWEVSKGVPKESAYEDALCAWRKIEKLLNEFTHEYALEPEFIVAFGFSQGGALLSVPLQEEPTKFKGVALLASLAIPVPTLKGNVSNGTLPAVFIGHGERDAVIPIEHAERTVQLLRSIGHNVTLITDLVEHKVGVVAMRGLGKWCASL